MLRKGEANEKIMIAYQNLVLDTKGEEEEINI